MDHEHGATALAEQNQFDLAAAQHQGEMLLANGTDADRNNLSMELLANSGNITLAAEEFEGVGESDISEAYLRLAMGVATEARSAGITAETTADDLKAMYGDLFKQAADYKATEGQEGYSADVAKAKAALAMSVWNKLETPAAVDLSRW